MQSSVLVCWLGFGQAGLASLPTSAFVAQLQLSTTEGPIICRFYENADFLSAVLTVT